MAKSHQDELVTRQNTKNLGDTKIYFSAIVDMKQSQIYRLVRYPNLQFLLVRHRDIIFLICGCTKNINKFVRHRDIIFPNWGCKKTLNSQFREAPEFKMSIGEA